MRVKGEKGEKDDTHDRRHVKHLETGELFEIPILPEPNYPYEVTLAKTRKIIL